MLLWTGLRARCNDHVAIGTVLASFGARTEKARTGRMVSTTADSIDGARGARRRDGQDRQPRGASQSAARGAARGATQAFVGGAARDSEARGQADATKVRRDATKVRRNESPASHGSAPPRRPADDGDRAQPQMPSEASGLMEQSEQSATPAERWTAQSGPRDSHGRWIPVKHTTASEGERHRRRDCEAVVPCLCTLQ
jgi:hypothetical protein